MRDTILFLILAASALAQVPQVPASTQLKDTRAAVNAALSGITPASIGALPAGTSVLPTSVIDVRSKGAKGDEQIRIDGQTTAGSAVLTSASGFTTLDTGKTLTVEMGDLVLYSGSYTSGVNAVGAPGSTCTLSAFTGGSGATATLYLSATDTIPGGSTIYITAQGSGFVAAPTSATVSSGTATCSGTPVLSTVLFSLPVTTTATFASSTTITMGASAPRTSSGVHFYIGTDDSTAVLAAIASAYSAGGGTVYFPVGTYLITQQITNPYNGQGTAVKLLGEGAMWNGPSVLGSKAATTLDMRYAGAVAKIDTRNTGVLTIESINLTDYGVSSTPFIQSTFTALQIRYSSFWGNPSKLGMNCDQDAILLGGGSTSQDGAATASFQGYMTVVDSNYFSSIRRMIYIRSFSDHSRFSNNFGSIRNGSTAAAAGIELDGAIVNGHLKANSIASNTISTDNYVYGITIRDAAGAMAGSDNMFINSGYPTLADVRLTGTAGKSVGNSCTNCNMAHAGGSTGANRIWVDDAGGNGFTWSDSTNLSANPIGVPTYPVANVNPSFYFPLGAMIFDSTTKLPLWNNGANWVSAIGAINGGAGGDTPGPFRVSNQACVGCDLADFGAYAVGRWQFVNAGSPTTRTRLVYYDATQTQLAQIAAEGSYLNGAGGLSVGSNVAPAGGIINAQVGFKAAGTAGITQTCSTAITAMTVVGGIITSMTCP